MLEFLTSQTILIFIAFVIIVFILYKLFRVALQATLVAAAAFAFPWIARAIGLPVEPSMEIAVYFAAAGLGLFFVYQFFHFIVYFFKIATWPLRVLLGHKKEKELKKLEGEVEELEKK